MNGNRHFLGFFNSNSHSHSCNFFFGIAIPIPILILELGFHESTTELGQLLISDKLRKKNYNAHLLDFSKLNFSILERESSRTF